MVVPLQRVLVIELVPCLSQLPTTLLQLRLVPRFPTGPQTQQKQVMQMLERAWRNRLEAPPVVPAHALRR